MKNKGPVQSHPNPWDFLVTKKATPAFEVMTKREAFAAMAMQGLLSGPDELKNFSVAELSVMHADALIAELAKGTEPCNKA